jgi:glycosyltransferase involved in cell wall biosynthesis
MKRPRLAFFIHNMGSGGAQRIMLTLGEAIARQDCDVDLVLVRAEGPRMSEIPPTIRVVDLGARRIITSLPKLMRYLRENRPSALMSFLSPVNCVAIAARALAAPATRLVISERSTFTPAIARPLDRLVLPWLMRWSYPFADALIAISNGVAQDIHQAIGLDKSMMHVVYNPALNPRLRHLADEPIDHPWFANGAPPVVLGVGRLTEQKDFPTLIRAFAKVRATRPVRLMILGEGADRDSLIRLARDLGISDDVTLPGFERNPYKYMRGAALFAFSSRWEGFGNVLVEAMALGTPVVSTDCPSGPAEILEGGRWGRLVPVGDVQQLATAMASTLENRAPDARARAEAFAVERIAAEYLAILIPGSSNEYAGSAGHSVS